MSYVPQSGVSGQYYNNQPTPTFYGTPLDFKFSVGGGSESRLLSDLIEGVNIKKTLYPGLQIVSVPDSFAQYDKGTRHRIINIASVPGVGDFVPEWHAVRDDNKRFTIGANVPANTAEANKDYLDDDIFLETSTNKFWRLSGNTWSEAHSISIGGGGTVTGVTASSSNTQGLTLTASGTTSIAISLAGTIQVNLANTNHVTGILPIGNGGTGASSLGAGLIYSTGSVLTSVGQGTNGYVFMATGTNTYSWTNPTWTSNTGTVTSIQAGIGLIASPSPITSSGTIALTGQALAIHNLNSNGIVVRTSSGVFTPRSIGAGTGISITNGDGVSGAPSIALSNSGVSANTYGVISSVNYPVITIDATGRITSASTTIIRSASDTVSGIVTTGTQPFAGDKTFSGAIALGSTLSVTGNVTVNTNKFTIVAATGATSIASSLAVAGSFAIAGTKFTVNTDGVVYVDSSITCNGNFIVNGTFARFSVDSATGDTTVAGSISVDKFARSGYSYDTIAAASVSVSLDDGNSFFYKLDAGTPATVTILLTETNTTLWNNHRGGSFIITIYNTSASTKTIVFGDERFKDIYDTANDTVELAQNESLTYSGMVLGTGTSDCDLYGIISDGIVNLKV